MLRRSSASLLVCTLIAALARADGHAPAQLPIARHVLANGMTIVVAPDPSASSVHLSLRFAGGAGDETDMEAGYTRLVEGLFTDGSVHTKAGEQAQRIEAAGGWTSSQTTLDELVLSTEVPPEATKLALWLDAERMAGLADAITDPNVQKEREAIGGAYRAAYVDEPYAVVERAVRQALWAAGSPNRNDVLGDPGVLARASAASVRAFVREHIRPERATLVISGNVPAEVESLARMYFGWIPGGHAVAAVSTHVAPRARPENLDVRAPLSEIVIAYRLPSDADDRVSFAILARMIAGTFVDLQQPTELRADLVEQARGDELQVHVVPAPGSEREAIERLAERVRSAIASLARGQMSAERITHARSTWLTEHLLAIESLAGRAAAYPAWGSYASIDGYVAAVAERAARVTPEQLARLAATWLAPSAAVTVIGHPGAP